MVSVARLRLPGSGIVLARSRTFWLQVLCSRQTPSAPDPQLCSPASSPPASPASAPLPHTHLSLASGNAALCFPLAECGSPAAPTRDPRSCSDFWAGMAGRRQLGSSQAPGPRLTLKTGPQGAQVLECRWWPRLGLAGWCVPPPSSPQQHPLHGHLGRGGRTYTAGVRTQISALCRRASCGHFTACPARFPKVKVSIVPRALPQMGLFRAAAGGERPGQEALVGEMRTHGARSL